MSTFTPENVDLLKKIVAVSGTNYYGAGNGIGTVKNVPTPQAVKSITTAQPSQNLFQKIGAIAGQTADIAGHGIVSGVKFAANTPKYLYRDFEPLVKGGITSIARSLPGGQNDLKAQAQYRQSLDAEQTRLMLQYKAGKVSKTDYSRRLQDLSKSYQQISKENTQLLQTLDRGNIVESAINSAVDILSLGSFSLVKAGAKQAAPKLLNGFITKAVPKLESLITKIPAVAPLLERNAGKTVQKVAGESTTQWLQRSGKQVAVGLLIKRPVFYQTNIGGAQDVYGHILEDKNYGAAATESAWLGTQMLAGGPLGAFGAGYKWLKKGVRDLSYGNQSFIDGVSRQIGNGNPNQITKFLQTMQQKAPQEFEEANRVFKILQETNLQAASDDVPSAVNGVMDHYVQHGADLNSLTPSQLYKDFRAWAQADELAQKTLKAGLVNKVNPEDAANYVVVRWDKIARQGLIDTYAKEGAQGVAELMQRPGVSWSSNRILSDAVESVVNTNPTPEEFARAINSITTASTILAGVPKKVSQELADLGYSIAAPFGGRKTPVVDENDLRKLVTGAIKGEDNVFDEATQSYPPMGALAGALRKVGLSPESTNKVANRALQTNVVANLDELGVGRELGLVNTQGGDIAKGGSVILSTLEQYIEKQSPSKVGQVFVGGSAQTSAVTDVRQLTTHEIREALGKDNVTTAQASAIQKAIVNGYLKVPMDLRGAGDKAVDWLYKVNPLQKYYSRIQSAMRYTYNPFFKTQEATETLLLSGIQGGNRATRLANNHLLWNKTRDELDGAVKELDTTGIFTSSLPGEAAQDQLLGRLTANITRGQKRDLAGLALDMADKRGLTLPEMLNQHSDEVADALRVVVQYPTKGVLASPLARTLNLAFFPIRYNTKVTLLAAKVLSQQPPSIQLATIHSLYNMRNWLKTDEGIQWQSDHTDAIQLLNWVTPVNSIESVFNLLTHKPDSWGSLGALGGLPLGFISQVLDSEGVINLNTPYVNPKNGDVFPDYVPQTTKAQTAVALQDLFNSMFTYPGRVLGLPGKQATIRKVVDDFIDTNGTDFDKQYKLEDLTPLQQKWIRVLKGDTSAEAIDDLYNAPAEGQFNWYTLPPLDLPAAQRVDVPGEIPVLTKTQVKAMKDAQKGSGSATGPKEKNKALPVPTR